jgi:hypothetical protein
MSERGLSQALKKNKNEKSFLIADFLCCISYLKINNTFLYVPYFIYSTYLTKIEFWINRNQSVFFFLLTGSKSISSSNWNEVLQGKSQVLGSGKRPEGG